MCIWSPIDITQIIIART